MKTIVASYMRDEVAKFVRARARAAGFSVSGYLERLVEQEMIQSNSGCAKRKYKNADPFLRPKAELERRLREGDDPKNLTTFNSIEELRVHMDRIFDESLGQ